MKNILLVKIIHPENYRRLPGSYGVLIKSMDSTAIINFNSNLSGLCINIAHGDYRILSSNEWGIHLGEVFVVDNGRYIPTGLAIWDL